MSSVSISFVHQLHGAFIEVIYKHICYFKKKIIFPTSHKFLINTCYFLSLPNILHPTQYKTQFIYSLINVFPSLTSSVTFNYWQRKSGIHTFFFIINWNLSDTTNDNDIHSEIDIPGHMWKSYICLKLYDWKRPTKNCGIQRK